MASPANPQRKSGKRWEQRRAEAEENFRRIWGEIGEKTYELVGTVMGRKIAIVDNKVVMFDRGNIRPVPTHQDIRKQVDNAIMEKFGRHFEYYKNE